MCQVIEVTKTEDIQTVRGLFDEETELYYHNPLLAAQYFLLTLDESENG